MFNIKWLHIKSRAVGYSVGGLVSPSLPARAGTPLALVKGQEDIHAPNDNLGFNAFSFIALNSLAFADEAASLNDEDAVADAQLGALMTAQSNCQGEQAKDCVAAQAKKELEAPVLIPDSPYSASLRALQPRRSAIGPIY